MMNTNTKILNQLREKAFELLPLTGIDSDGILNAEQIDKYITKHKTWNYKNDIVTFTADSFTTEIGLHYLFGVLYRWESMMNIKHQRFETGVHRERRNFYCQYMKDGKSELKKIELTQALPNLWYKELRHNNYDIYVKIHEQIAVMVRSAELYFNPANVPEYLIRTSNDFKTFLLTEAAIIPAYIIEAYIRIKDYDFIQKLAVRKMELDKAEEERQKEREEQRRINAEREAERKRIEAERKAEAERVEKERLAKEEERFKNGEMIDGSDIVTLCRIYGIDMHLRTIHNLNEVVANINGNGECQYYVRYKGKRKVKPTLEGCYEVARHLYDRLNS